MVMTDRPVIVSLRKSVVRVMRGARLAAIIMDMRHATVVGVIGHLLEVVAATVALVPVGMVRDRLNIVVVTAIRDGEMLVLFVSLARPLPHIDLQVVAVIEDRTGQRRRRMLDLENVLHPVEHDDRHLDRQRHAQSHAEHGDVPFGDCETLTDHNSSRPYLDPQV